MKRSAILFAVLAMAFALASQARAQASETRFDVGLRGVVLFGKGEPANDMIGEGLIAHWRIRPAWHVGVAFESVTFDFETPNEALGIASATVVDGSNDLSRVSIFVDRRYDSPRRWDWFWRAGVGFASVDAPSVTGIRADGGVFDIATDADDEIHFFAGGGLRRLVSERWSLETALTVEHHTTDYTLIDRVSGARATIGAQSLYGLAVGVSYRF